MWYNEYMICGGYMKFADIKKSICVFFKKCLFYAREIGFRRSYSQFGEDILLQSFLGDKWSWGYKGFWVDIGAHHPSNLSNTKAFALNGWRGINVDASFDAIAKFNRHRKRDINVNVGIGLVPGMLDYYRMSSSPMNTFSKDFADRAVEEGCKLIDVVKVPVITMKELLDKYLPEGQTIDFVSIDCEGFDLSILQSNDWDRYRPEYILIEIHVGGENWEIPNCPVSHYLKKQGYEFVGQSYVTTLYKRVR
jgi:FkbM family methyltransferase